jgi:hypothetical protein
MVPGTHTEMRVKIPEQPKSRHLLTQSFGGTVSLIKDLTKAECEKASAIVAPTDDYRDPGPGFITSAECFQ